VNLSRHPRRSTLLSHRLPRSCRGDVKPVTATPLDSAPLPRAKSRGTNGGARNPFRPLRLRAVFARRIRFYENCRVSPGLFNVPTFERSNVSTHFLSIPSLFIFFRTLFRNGAPLSLLFSNACALFRSRRGCTPLVFPPRLKMNRSMANFNGSNVSLRCPQYGSTRAHSLPRPRFASQPHECLLNCIDPSLHEVGLAGYFPQRPRS